MVSKSLGVVAIGRNEGERLRSCLLSVSSNAEHVVYVDSCSTDNSVEIALSFGATIVELDPRIHFSAARARNAGLERILEIAPDLEYLQFLDGDCQLEASWLENAVETLNRQPEVAIVCGRRREKFPEASVYNLLCDIEWDTPIGEAKACGGDALMRVSPLTAAGGYDPTVIAAEDDELCVRLRQSGWKVLRINHDMTWHDAAMTRPKQWWRRAVRAGHGFAQGAAMHGASPERHFVQQERSCLIWGGLMPLLAIAMAFPTKGLSVVLLGLLYLVLMVRVFRCPRCNSLSTSHAWIYAANCVLAKFPGCVGALKFHFNQLCGVHTRIIEYK